jgi:Family of unknown function (DUF5519)
VFSFAVRYLGFLKHVPLLPHLFETLLKMGTLLSNKVILDHIDDIETEVLSWKGTSTRSHKFGGLQFDVDKREIGHIHGNGLLDILFNRDLKAKLIADGKAMDHHIFPNSGWISFYIKTSDDRKNAIELLQRSYDLKKNQPPDRVQNLTRL